MLEKGLFLISFIGCLGVIAYFTVVNSENVFAFKPIEPSEAAPTPPLVQSQPETTTQVSPQSMSATSSLPFLNYENSTHALFQKNQDLFG